MPVYFIQAGEDGPVKIGSAKDVAKRVINLQSGNHKKLRLISVRPGGLTEEGLIQKQFADDRLTGEWFRPSDRLLREADKFPSPKPPARSGLQQYLKNNGLTATEFASRISRSTSTVTRAAKGDVIPDLTTMLAIKAETDGQVQPNDFYRQRVE